MKLKVLNKIKEAIEVFLAIIVYFVICIFQKEEDDC
jgi:hypothetical protein